MSVNSLPPPSSQQAYCDVSALEGGILQLPCALMVNTAEKDEKLEAPSLSFIVSHSPTGTRIVFDLGIRKDWERGITNPNVVQRIRSIFATEVETDVPDSLAKGGLAPSDITHVCLSHCHWDHVGNPALFKNARFLVGAEARTLFQPGYPEDSKSLFAADLLPTGRTDFLDTTSERWVPIGPFPRALDYFGDGALYLVDAPGHLAGHLNLLARTSADGAWIYLAGDSAHDWRLVRGQGEIAVSHDEHGGVICMHLDIEAAAATIRRIADVMTLPRVRVILAHDAEWFVTNRGGSAFFPSKIESL